MPRSHCVSPPSQPFNYGFGFTSNAYSSLTYSIGSISCNSGPTTGIHHFPANAAVSGALPSANTGTGGIANSLCFRVSAAGRISANSSASLDVWYIQGGMLPADGMAGGLVNFRPNL